MRPMTAAFATAVANLPPPLHVRLLDETVETAPPDGEALDAVDVELASTRASESAMDLVPTPGVAALRALPRRQRRRVLALMRESTTALLSRTKATPGASGRARLPQP